MSISGTNEATQSVPFGTPVDTGDANAAGTAGTAARSDHVHKGVVANEAWSTYVPTLTQLGTVTHTVNSATYIRAGRIIHFFVDLSVTGSGTGGNNVTATLPVAARTSGGGLGVVGSGTLFDTSASTRHNGVAATPSATTVGLLPGNSNTNAYIGVADFSAGLASGDRIHIAGTYEAAS